MKQRNNPTFKEMKGPVVEDKEKKLENIIDFLANLKQIVNPDDCDISMLPFFRLRRAYRIVGSKPVLSRDGPERKDKLDKLL